MKNNIEKTHKFFTIALKQETYRKIKIFCAKNGKTMRSFFEECVGEVLKNDKI